jgi:hypothetical protein
MMMLITVACNKADRNAPNTGKNEPSATSPEKSTGKEQAFVRVVYAVPGTTADVYADDQKEFTGIEYKTVTPYQTVSDERHTFSVKEANQDNKAPFMKESESLKGGEHYTLVVYPGKDNNAGTLKVVEDKVNATTSGKAKVRVINASHDEDDLKIYITGQKDALFSGTKPQTESSYKEVDPMSGGIEVRAEDKQNPIVTVDANFEAGNAYTIVLFGYTNVNPKLEVVLLNDELTTEPGFKTPSPIGKTNEPVSKTPTPIGKK